MRHIPKDHPLYPPLPKEDLRRLFKQLFAPITKGESSTLRLGKYMGGGWVFTKYMVENYGKLWRSLLFDENGDFSSPIVVYLKADTAQLFLLDIELWHYIK